MSAESTRDQKQRQTMIDRPDTRDSLIRRSLIRGFWFMMLVSHAPALVAAWRGWGENGFQAERVVGILFLAAAMLFFFAKLAGLSCLRVRLDRRTVIALCLAVALVHAGCLDVELRPDWLTHCAVILATISVVFAAYGIILKRLRDQLMIDALGHRVIPGAGRSRGTVWLDDTRPRCWVLCSHLFQLRAPPV